MYFSFFFLQILYFTIFSTLFLPTTFTHTHTHDPHPRPTPTTHTQDPRPPPTTHDPRPTTFSYTPHKLAIYETECGEI